MPNISGPSSVVKEIFVFSLVRPVCRDQVFEVPAEDWSCTEIWRVRQRCLPLSTNGESSCCCYSSSGGSLEFDILHECMLVR